MAGGGSRLPPQLFALVHQRVNAWRANPSAEVDCPVCERPGLAIIDRSARPYSEWYQITCGACGLDATLQIPMSPPSGA